MARTNLIKYPLMVFVILGCGIVSNAQVNWIVPGAPPLDTIQNAIDSVVDNNDTITVIGNPAAPIIYSAPGFFNVDFKGYDITVQTGEPNGTYRRNAAIINCGNLGRGFIFESGETSSARLQGFIIRNGYAEDPLWPREPNDNASGYGGGIYIKNSSPIIRQCVITDCSADAGGGAIFCDDNANAFISDCNIGLSYTSYNSAGVGFYNYIDINDVNDVNALDVNDLHQLGGGIYCRNSSPQINNCRIYWNVSFGSGGGIACESSNASIINSNIWDNYCYVNDDRIDQHGGGIYIKDCTGAGPWISGCSIMSNAARWSGGGIAVINSNAKITESPINRCEIIDNDCWASAGGIYCEGNPSGDPNADPNNPNCLIQYSDIAHNWGYWCGGVSSDYGSFADINNCTITQNVASWSWLVGGLECYGGGGAKLTNTIIWGNTGIEQAGATGGSALAMAAGGVEMETAEAGINTAIKATYSNIQMFDSEGYYDPTAVWPGEGNINKDPLFISPVRRPYNFHLTADEWNISPSINAGNPFADYSKEPMPNGGRINMGSYGGTGEADCSDILRPVPSDADADLAVNMFDFAILADNWGLEGENIKNKTADADNNGVIDGRDLAILHKFWLWLQ